MHYVRREGITPIKMDIYNTYTKKRKDCGRQPLFCEVAAHLIDSIPSDTKTQKEYMLRNPVHNYAQASESQSHCEINTRRVVLLERGMNHAEGGWPKDVQFNDEEAVARYRRRIERDDSYIHAVLNTYQKFEHNIDQNNAIEMYQMYFSNMPVENPVEKYFVTIRNVFRDPSGPPRPISCIDWTIEDDTKLVTSYCDKTYPLYGNTYNVNTECYLWNLEKPIDPSNTLYPPKPCWQLSCSPANASVIVGGLEDGRVCIFDIRASDDPVAISPFHLAHRDPVTALLYIQSRLNTEFFSGSTDGKCMWWDVRNLMSPTDLMIIALKAPLGADPMDMSNSEPISTLQFDRAFPTRFLCGTDTGLIINVNRKGKTISETMTSVFNSHHGPVKAVHRSPLTSKMFISCGDWTVHIWSDEVTVSPIVTGMAHRLPITDVCWAPHRISAYMSICGDGKFRFWDLLRKYEKPIVNFPVSKNPLLKMKVHEDGKFVAIGDCKGNTYLVALSENMVMPGERDKPIMLQTYERENHRERILENRVKEIRLKLKTEEEATVAPEIDEVNEDENVKLAEDEYKKIINDELMKSGMPMKPFPSTTGETTLRKR